VAFDGQQEHDIAPVPTQAIDTVGAGDMFAGAFLYGITHAMGFARAGRLASRASSRIVSSMGPRLTQLEIRAELEQFLQESVVAGNS
jgi:sugar/nucleoside kinase (ribokinase family)